MTRVAVIGWPQETNEELVQAWRERGLRASLLSPVDALWAFRRGDVAIGWLDVVRSLDGVEPGLDVLGLCERAGVRVLNRAAALLNAHDKLLTARRLRLAGVRHPKSVFVAPTATASGSLPRSSSSRDSEAGAGTSFAAIRRLMSPSTPDTLSTRTWFQHQRALAQELLPPAGFDLRLVVAGGRLVGAIERIAAPGEWRTNVSLGGRRRRVELPEEAVRLGLAAVDGIDGDFVGVDLLPVAGDTSFWS
jgi:glutathione synthase/RimK-type ligase-like ATP-grasp enzyme